MAPTKEEINAGIPRLSSNMRWEASKLESMAWIRNQSNNPYKCEDLPAHIDPSTLYPSKASLEQSTNFGKSNSKRSFVVKAGMPQVLLPVFKAGFLSEETIQAITTADVRCDLLFKSWQKSKRVDFRILRLPGFGWEDQEEAQKCLNIKRMRLRLMCLVYYDLDIQMVIRYCGWKFTGQHRRHAEQLFWIRYITDHATFQMYARGAVEGVPVELQSNEHNTYENYKKYRKMGNQTNVAEYPDLVGKAFVKEDAREISLIFPGWVVDFMLHIWIIPLGMSVLDHKKPRMYRHATKMVDTDSWPANRLIATEKEPEILYADTQLRYIEYLWRIRASYPDHRIMAYGDDLAAYYNHFQMAPGIVGANVSSWKGYTIVPVGNHFGGRWGPSSAEPGSNLRGQMAEWLYNNREQSYFVQLNQEIFEIVSIQKPALEKPLAAAFLDNDSQRQTAPDGSFKSEYFMYVDDSQQATIESEPVDWVGDCPLGSPVTRNEERMATASTEAAYLLLGYPGKLRHPVLPPTIANDKGEMINPCERTSLGLTFKPDELLVMIPDRRIDKLETILREQWNRNRKVFTARAVAQLIGNLQSCLWGCLWLRQLDFFLLDALKTALRKNGKRLIHSKHYQALLQEKDKAWLDPDAERKTAKLLGLTSEMARALWRCEEQTYIPGEVHDDAEYILRVIHLHRHDSTTWARHMSTIVRRRPDRNFYQDASTSWGIGGHSPDQKVFWQVRWDDIDPALPQFIKSTLNKPGDQHAHINWLEMAACVMNLACSIVCDAHHGTTHNFPPRVMLWGDNMTANKTTQNGTSGSSSRLARALSRVISWLIREHPHDLRTAHIPGVDNTFADDLSRHPCQHTFDSIKHLDAHHACTYLCLPQTSNPFALVASYKRFIPHQKLLSLISVTLSNPAKVGHFQKMNASDLGHLSDGSNIFTSSWPSA